LYRRFRLQLRGPAAAFVYYRNLHHTAGLARHATNLCARRLVAVPVRDDRRVLIAVYPLLCAGKAIHDGYCPEPAGDLAGAGITAACGRSSDKAGTLPPALREPAAGA